MKMKALVLMLSIGLTPAIYAETTDEKIKVLQGQINALADKLEEEKTIRRTTSPQSGGSATKQTKIGGYGELHYNNLEKDDGSDTKDKLDFHRFVLFFNHSFSEKTRFFSELELEHSIAGEDKVGEIELEQAYIEHDISPNLKGKAGIMLIPVGILNETHEPNTFYGVERNPVEKNIIPATWWGGGIGLSGNSATGLSYDLMFHEGLNIEASDDFKIRSGRQKTGKAEAKDFATTGRIKYTGLPGVELAASAQYQSDFAQGESHGGSGTLFETHAIYNKGPFTAKGLYARWKLDSAAAEAVSKDKQEGGYIEASYKVLPKVGVFARQSQYNTGGAGATAIKQSDFGVNYFLNENVVFKADYQNQSSDDDSKASDGFNLGVGYQF